MTSPVTITIGGEPVAKGRPRMTRKGFAYTPAATRKFEAHGRLAAQLAMDGRPPIAVPVRAEVRMQRCAVRSGPRAAPTPTTM